MKPKIVTIGVYGFNEAAFFNALQAAKVDTFCDVRRRRGVRGSAYAFANSERLQRHLSDMGIKYHHFIELAPPQQVRELQNEADKKQRIAKRSRAILAPEFIRAYEEQCLFGFDSAGFIERLGPDAQVICLFCVEAAPEACHRSLLAARLASDLGLKVEHITP